MKKTKEKEYWEMSLQELVEEWWDNDMSKYDEEKWYSMPESQRLFYLWQALARDMEEIKKKITK